MAFPFNRPFHLVKSGILGYSLHRLVNVMDGLHIGNRNETYVVGIVLNDATLKGIPSILL